MSMNRRERFVRNEDLLRASGGAPSLGIVSFWVNAAALTFPLWGTVLTALLMCKISEVFFYIGALFGLGSGLPILFSSADGMLATVGKILVFFGYYFVGIFVVFFVGWISLCKFCPTCH